MLQHEFLIGTVRFNNKTYIENLKWKQRKEYNGCAYGLDKPLSNKIPSGKYIYIVEMNNEINKIMGIGKIKNIIIHSNRSRMYNEDRLNNYIYKSKDFISRLKIIETQPKGELVLKFLENLLFRGSKHFKRGQGCVILPWNRISTAGNIIKTKDSSYPVKNLKNKCRICGKTRKGHICEALKKNLLLEKFIYNWFVNIFNDIPADVDNGPHI
jgi:hypothetical protein|tara:strand:- start:2 stop:637 length:636 start_codon:yes stop_codon:yes gene_type:complete